MGRKSKPFCLLGVVALLASTGCGSESEVRLRMETQDAILSCALNAPSPGYVQQLGNSPLKQQCRYAMSLFLSDYQRMGEPPELEDLGNALAALSPNLASENRQQLLEVALATFGNSK